MTIDRAVGAFIGAACGDALGAQVEFRARGCFKTPKRMVKGGTYNLPAGCWTDDTAMALALADSLLHDDKLDEQDVMKRWLSWLDKGEYIPTGHCFDVGQRTSAALRAWKRKKPISTRTYENGNGALMRVSPVGLIHTYRDEEAYRVGRSQGLLTHGPLAASAAGAYAVAVSAAIRGKPFNDIEEYILMTVPEMRDHRQLSLDDVESGGHYLDTLEASMWCIRNTDNFADAVILAVSLGNDTDTTACVTGSLAGALYGKDAIPLIWTRKLNWYKRLEDTARKLYQHG